MNALQNLTSERHEQNHRMAQLEERIVRMKENGERALKKYKEVSAKNKKLKEELNKPFWKKLVG